MMNDQRRRRQIFSLHRYFMWADRMRVHYGEVGPTTSSATEAMFHHPYLSYYYGGMYVVSEGWKRLDLHDPEIDELLTSENVGRLERHRHGTFHYHPEYFDDRLLAFPSGPDSAEWIWELRHAFSRWFLAELDSWKGERP
jgi:hypothetical protein